MFYNFLVIIAFPIFLGLILLSVALGNYVGKKKLDESGLGVTEGAVFTLMGLLIAFTFSSASQRFDERRAVMINEANAISTAYLRLELVQPSDRLELQKDFLNYIDARLAIYKAFPNASLVHAAINTSGLVQEKLWQDAVLVSKNAKLMTVSMLVLPAINNMFDLAKTRIVSFYFHPHYLIFVLLIIVSLLCGFLTGYGISKKGAWNALHVIVFASLIAFTIYIIFDLEAPRYGFIKETSFDYLLQDLRDGIGKQLHDEGPTGAQHGK